MKLMVLDGNSIINRAFYGVSQTLTTRAGQPTNAVFGFLNILNKLLQERTPDALCVTFDRKAPTFRHLAYEGYKAQRKGMPDELASQMPIVKEILSAMNIPIYELDGWEADDLIGTIAKQDEAAGWDTVIVTGDKDSLQLVTRHTSVSLVSTRMGRTTTKEMTPEAFRAEYGFEPVHIIDLKALMGDVSDNIPGVKGVGEKTAMGLVQTYGSIDRLYERMPDVETAPGTPAKPGMIQKLREGEEMARLSYDLATIRANAPIQFEPQENLRLPVNRAKLYQLFLELEFSKLIEKYHLAAPQGEGAAQERQAAEQPAESEQVTDPARMEELLALWRGLSHVTFLALPALEGVNVQWEQEGARRSAVLMATSLSGYNAFLRAFFASGVQKVTHESKELCRSLLEEGITPEGILFDTEVAAYLLAPTDGSYQLEKLGLTYFNMQLPKAEAYLQENAFAPLSDPAAALAAWRSHTALVEQLYPLLSKRLNELDMEILYHTVDLPLCLVLAEMELAGVRINRSALAEFSQLLSEGIDREIAAIYHLAGEVFNINSTQQLGHVLFDVLGLPPVKKTKTGYSTNAEVLEKLQGQHPVIEHILEYRQLAKLKSTYADGLGKVIGEDGRIHTKFQNTVTATGRLSSVEPNLQNIPIRTELGAKLREMFEAPSAMVLVDADYSQIELRLLAHMARDEKMIAAFLSGQDFHTVTAGQVFGVAVDHVTPEMRRAAKAVNFGIVYGISAFSLARDIHVSVAEAKAYMDTYFATYTGVRDYMKQVVEQAKDNGYVTTLMNRRRWVPELRSSNFNTRSFGERVALNMPIQGTAADVIKLAMVRVRDRLKRAGLRGKLVLQVHDELIVECPEEELEEICALLQEEMEGVMSLSVPLIAQTAAGSTWAEAH